MSAQRFRPEEQPLFFRHPFAFLAALCLLAAVLTDGTSPSGFSREAPLLSVLLCVTGACIYLSRTEDTPLQIGTTLSFGTSAALLLAGLGCITHGAVSVLALTALTLLGFAAVSLKAARRLDLHRALLLLFAAGFCLRLAYIIYTPVTVRQHDVWYFGGKYGHAAYIDYFYNGGSPVLPFDPRLRWQFYHPPLHHMLAALWMRVQVLLGFSYARACEGVQILTLFYSSAVPLLCFRIFSRLRFHRAALLTAVGLVCFHPTGILFAGSINNDALSVCLQFAALAAALRWYDRPTVPHILVTALCIGGAMAAKLSGALCAPPVALLFFWKWWKNRRETERFFAQFAAFALVCVPLGLAWSVLNTVRWGMPPAYVPVLGSSNQDQYIGYIPAARRLLDFFPPDGNIFMAWGERSRAGYYEYNPFLGLLKTAVFGEFTLFDPAMQHGLRQGLGYIFCCLLFFLQLPLIALSAAGGIRSLCRPLRGSGLHTAFFAVLFCLTLLLYLRMCFDAPHTCTQNFRYTTPLLLCGTVWLGSLTEDAHPALRRTIAGFSGAFCLCSAAVFLLLAH